MVIISLAPAITSVQSSVKLANSPQKITIHHSMLWKGLNHSDKAHNSSKVQATMVIKLTKWFHLSKPSHQTQPTLASSSATNRHQASQCLPTTNLIRAQTCLGTTCKLVRRSWRAWRRRRRLSSMRANWPSMKGQKSPPMTSFTRSAVLECPVFAKYRSKMGSTLPESASRSPIATLLTRLSMRAPLARSSSAWTWKTVDGP